jgi:histidyl-tRNA synthetase
MRPVRGTKDLYPEDFYLYDLVVKTSREVGKFYGFDEMSTPIIEYTNVFNRTLGDTSDVVNKEMYSFEDRGGESITLRPEFTAGIMRSVISESKTHSLPLRLFSHGPIFRYDRPQAGRQRQFNQINFEAIGEQSIFADCDIISIADTIFKELGLSSFIKLEINSLGCQESRKNYQEALKNYLMKYEDELSDDSKIRLNKNPMRILDSKEESDKKIVNGAPDISKFYTSDAESRFNNILNSLTKCGINFSINKKLVRGLDYYCHTAFEFITEKLGAQSTVLGGGRYDKLAHLMSNGKYDIPSVGLAGGIERFMMLLASENNFSSKKIAIIPVGEVDSAQILQISKKMRDAEICCQIFSEGKIGKRIEKAISKGAVAAVFIGQDEINNSAFKLKNLASGEESSLSLESLLTNAANISK